MFGEQIYKSSPIVRSGVVRAMAHKKEELKEGCYGRGPRNILEFAENGGYEAIPEDEHETWFTRFKFWGLFHQRSGRSRTS